MDILIALKMIGICLALTFSCIILYLLLPSSLYKLVSLLKPKDLTNEQSLSKCRVLTVYSEFFDENVMLIINNKQVITDEELVADEIVNELQSLLVSNREQLYITAVEHAIYCIRSNGRTFHIEFDPYKDPNKSQAFIDCWNAKDSSELISWIDYECILKDKAVKIDELIRSQYPTVNSLADLHLYTAQSTLELGYTKDNFGNIFLAIEEQLHKNPEMIREYFRNISVTLFVYADNSKLWNVSASCDWKDEYDISWDFENGKIREVY